MPDKALDTKRADQLAALNKAMGEPIFSIDADGNFAASVSGDTEKRILPILDNLLPAPPNDGTASPNRYGMVESLSPTRRSADITVYPDTLPQLHYDPITHKADPNSFVTAVKQNTDTQTLNDATGLDWHVVTSKHGASYSYESPQLTGDQANTLANLDNSPDNRPLFAALTDKDAKGKPMTGDHLKKEKHPVLAIEAQDMTPERVKTLNDNKGLIHGLLGVGQHETDPRIASLAKSAGPLTSIASLEGHAGANGEGGLIPTGGPGAGKGRTPA